MTVTLDRGVAVISIDTELAWGEAHRRGGDAAGHDYRAERRVIDQMLAMFARYEISATWAVVGHLFLDRCESSNGRVHPEIVRPDYPWLNGDWYDIDPTSDLADSPYYYGRDIVEGILACPVPQEVGCHSFSHVMAGDPGCSEEAFVTDLAACRQAAEAFGVSLRSFVFPRNSIGHVDRLAGHGFRSYRGRPGEPFAGRRPALRAALRLVDRAYPLGGSAVLPRRHSSGSWDIPQTFLFAPADHRRLPVRVWAQRPLARLRQAARHRSVFHLWFHPHNITADPDRGLSALEIVCAEAARLRSSGRLDIRSMGDLAAYLERTTPRSNGRNVTDPPGESRQS